MFYLNVAFSLLFYYIFFMINKIINDTEEHLIDNTSTTTTLVTVIKEEKYEDKHWDKYHRCPKGFVFTDEDLKVEKDKYDELIRNEDYDESEHQPQDAETQKKEAYEYMKNLFLLRFKNKFIIENTPLGNVNMCYNHEKESFEYYSDKTIPYRYLEPVARKYVCIFMCKDLYIDMEEELKEAKKRKIEEDEHAKELVEKQKEEVKKTKDIFARLKTYNKETPSPNTSSVKGPNGKKTLPNHIKMKLTSQIQSANSNDTQLLKEYANRFTHQGRFTNLTILKTINKTVTNKNYAVTYAEFRKNLSVV